MKKNVWVSIIAGAAAVAAAAVAIAAFIKRKSEALSDHLDYDPEEYFEADEEHFSDGEEDEEPAECSFECENVPGSEDCENCPFADSDSEEDDEAAADADDEDGGEEKETDAQ